MHNGKRSDNKRPVEQNLNTENTYLREGMRENQINHDTFYKRAEMSPHIADP